DCCETLDLAVVGFLAPRLREAWIALKTESVAVAADRDDDLRSIGLPFGTKPRIGEPSAQKGAAPAGAIRVYAAPLAARAVGAPCAPRLVDFRDTHDLAAQRAAAARSCRQWFSRSGNLVHQRAWPCGSATGERGAPRARSMRPKAGIFSAGWSVSSPATRLSTLNSMPSTMPTLTPRSP